MLAILAAGAALAVLGVVLLIAAVAVVLRQRKQLASYRRLRSAPTLERKRDCECKRQLILQSRSDRKRAKMVPILSDVLCMLVQAK